MTLSPRRLSRASTLPSPTLSTQAPVRTRHSVQSPRKISSSIAPSRTLWLRSTRLIRSARSPIQTGVSAPVAAVVLGRDHEPALGHDARDPALQLAHRAPQQVLHAQEVRHEARARSFVEGLGGIDLLDPPLVHDRDPVREQERLVLVVRDEQERDPDALLQVLELDLHLVAKLRVERRHRLVEQQELRLEHERARERHALLLAAGQLGDGAPGEAFEAHEPERLRDLAFDLGCGQPAHLQPEGDVARDVPVREERVVLEDGVDRALVRRDGRSVPPRDRERAGVRPLEARHEPQQRRLAAARGPEQRDELARRHLQCDVADGGVAAIALGDAPDRERASHQGTAFHAGALRAVGAA